MKIKLEKIRIKDLFEGYGDDGDDGVVGYRGKLNIRPPFQREFIYDDEKQKAVIETILKGFPLNVMYWSLKNKNFELIDGQQRTLSICKFMSGEFSIKVNKSTKYFHSLKQSEKDRIENYELYIYFCEGTDDEKLEWFKIINIAGEKLTKQELRNAVYVGEFVDEAKRHFSKSGNRAKEIGEGYMSGKGIKRQEYLEKVLKWISDNKIEDYMSKYQKNRDIGKELWKYYVKVIDWAKKTFPNVKPEMKHIEWGELYNKYKNKKVDLNLVEKLYEDDEVTDKKGIYKYVFEPKPKNERFLSLRTFDMKVKRKVYNSQNGKCKECKENFKIEETQADHNTAWSKGGKTTEENCIILCETYNKSKSDK